MNEEINDQSNQSVDPEELRRELKTALAQAEENLNGWKRSQADFDNYQKRKEGESAELISFGKAAAFAQLLPVLDSLEQAMIHAPEIDDDKYRNWKNGLQGILKQMETTLGSIGIQKISVLGEKFDPNLHEAIKEVPGDDDGLIVDQIQTGFLLNGKLLRPSQVIVTKKSLSNE